MRIAAVLLLLLTSCATAPTTTAPVPLVPEWDAIPSGILEVLCRRLTSDAIGSGGGAVGIVSRTQPLITSSSLDSLQNAYFGRGNAGRTAEALSAADRMLPVNVGQGSCAWRSVEGIDPSRLADIMVAELSSPIPNPYERREAGLFARVSLGGRDASWYWIPLERKGDVWAPGHIRPLDLTDR